MSDTFPTFPLGKGTLDIIEKLQKVITLSVLHSIHIETDCGERGKARLKFANLHHYFLFTDIKKKTITVELFSTALALRSPNMKRLAE